MSLDSLVIFGNYRCGHLYPRNESVIHALSTRFDSVTHIGAAEEGVEGFASGKLPILKRFLNSIGAWFELFWQSIKLRKIIASSDVIYIPYPSYFSFLALWIVTKGRGGRFLIIDAFLLLYDTLVVDRKLISPNSLVASVVSDVEGWVLRQSDIIFIDTDVQGDRLAASYAIPRSSIVPLPVGIDESIWRPRPAPDSNGVFKVIFWGTFIPLHGVSTIIKSAWLLSESRSRIHIHLIGDGQESEDIESELGELRPENLTWYRGMLGASELSDEVSSAHCVLGIFGESRKAASVIPYKVQQAMAANKIIVTRASEAMVNLIQGVTEISGLHLVPANDAVALADSLIDIEASYENFKKGVNTRVLFEQKLSAAYMKNSISSLTLTPATSSRI